MTIYSTISNIWDNYPQNQANAALNEDNWSTIT